MTKDISQTTGSIPRLSIGMPVYNGADFLADAFDSLLSQTFVDFELIVSDNGSTDETEQICREYAARDLRIRYHREEANRGACWNFNRVFELARGSYFKFAAHDDLCAPDFLERCVAVLDDDPSVVCCHTRTAKVDSGGAEIPGVHDPTDGELRLMRKTAEEPGRKNRMDGTSMSAHRRFADVLLNSGWSVRSYGVIRSGALKQTGMLRTVFGYEKVMMGELALQGRYHIVQETLFFQRVHPQAASSKMSAAEQHEIVSAGQKRQRRSIPHLQLLAGHLRAVFGMPISTYQRLRCLCWIPVYLLQFEKWRAVLRSIVRGTGTGGANIDVMKKMQIDRPSGSSSGQPLKTAHTAD